MNDILIQFVNYIVYTIDKLSIYSYKLDIYISLNIYSYIIWGRQTEDAYEILDLIKAVYRSFLVATEFNELNDRLKGPRSLQARIAMCL